MTGEVKYQRIAHGLTALGRSATPRQNRYMKIAGDVDGSAHVFRGAGDDHTSRENLVDGGIGAVAAAREGVEQHVSLDRPTELACQGRVGAGRHYRLTGYG